LKKIAKRGTIEIFYEILSACREPVNKTRIIYHCNLNFIMFQKYLEVLIASGLIDISNNKTKELYLMTEKGKNFIEYYRRLMGLIIDKQTKIMALVNDYYEHVPHIYESQMRN